MGRGPHFIANKLVPKARVKITGKMDAIEQSDLERGKESLSIL